MGKATRKGSHKLDRRLDEITPKAACSACILVSAPDPSQPQRGSLPRVILKRSALHGVGLGLGPRLLAYILLSLSVCYSPCIVSILSLSVTESSIQCILLSLSVYYSPCHYSTQYTTLLVSTVLSLSVYYSPCQYTTLLVGILLSLSL